MTAWEARRDAPRSSPGESLRLLIKDAARLEGCEPWEVTTGRSFPHTVRARARVARILRAKGWSLNRIGKALGRHHTSILHLLKNVHLEEFPAIVAVVDEPEFDPNQPDESGIWAI